MQSKYLITGESGFIGQRLSTILRKVNIKVVSLGRKPNHGQEYILCDLEKETIPEKACREINTVFHLAGIAHDFSDQTKAADRYQKLNIDATLNLAKNASQNGVKVFAYVSSVKVTGLLNFVKCASEDIQAPSSGLYGKSKREA